MLSGRQAGKQTGQSLSSHRSHQWKGKASWKRFFLLLFLSLLCFSYWPPSARQAGPLEVEVAGDGADTVVLAAGAADENASSPSKEQGH
jgi:hypothetical protein